MMGGSGEPTLDTSQRSEEAAPQGEREGGRTSRCVKHGYFKGWMYLARRFTWGAAEGKQCIVFSIQHVHVDSTSNLHHIEETVNLYLEHHASLCKQQFLNGSHYTLSLVQ